MKKLKTMWFYTSDEVKSYLIAGGIVLFFLVSWSILFGIIFMIIRS